MAKRDIQLGEFTKYAHRKYGSLARSTEIAREVRERQKQTNKPKVKGIRETVLSIYSEKGLISAYQVLKAYNKKIGKDVYTQEIFENWISEYNKYNRKGSQNDVGFDR